MSYNNIFISQEWSDYALIDASSGERLEQWKNVIVRRPDPQIIWQSEKKNPLWNKVNAQYHRNNKGGGKWEYFTDVAEKWIVQWKRLKFFVKPTNFKHLGLFPEQSINWEWMINKIQNSAESVNILNLFAYTGGATIACASAGANITHIDSSKGAIHWAKENLKLSGLEHTQCRFITDDVTKFVEREIRRNKKYDAIILDPPSFGRGPKGEVWKLEKELYKLLEMLTILLSDKPLFFIINCYTTGLSHLTLKNVLNMTVNKKFKCDICSGELCIKTSSTDILVPCGIIARCS